MSTNEIIELLIRSNALKRIQRSGWIIAGVQEKTYESVAAHSWGTCLISLIISKQLKADGYEIDQGHVLELSTIHDIPEAVLTDIPHSAIDIVGQELIRVKKDAEKRSLESLFIPLEDIGKNIIKVWESSTNLKSIESRIVAGSDIIDMLVHAISLERNGVSPAILDSFFNRSSKKIDSLDISILRDMHSILLKEHEKNLRNQELVPKNKD